MECASYGSLRSVPVMSAEVNTAVWTPGGYHYLLKLLVWIKTIRFFTLVQAATTILFFTRAITIPVLHQSLINRAYSIMP